MTASFRTGEVRQAKWTKLSVSPRVFVVILILICFMALLALTEITLRIFDFPLLRLDPIATRAAYDYDPELGWIPHANSVKQQTASRTVTLRHNSLGLRDVELLGTGGPTILFLGSSFVYGIEVEAEERFTERLRSNLPGVRIVNAGVPGYGNDQEYVLLQRIWPRVQPTVVILIFGPGDRVNNASNYRYHAFKPYLEKVGDQWQIRGQPVPKSPTEYSYHNWVANHFAFVRLLMLAYWSRRNYQHSVPDASEQLVSMMRDFVQTHGARFMVGLQQRDAAMESFLSSQKIPYVRFDGAEVYPNYGSHWTPAGHALVAERLTSLFSEQGVVPAKAASR